MNLGLGFQLGTRRPGGPVLLLRDTFTDADSTLLHAHTMDVGPGWSSDEQNVITGNKAAKGAGGQGRSLAESGYADVTASVTVRFSAFSDAYYGVGARGTDCLNYWIWGCDPVNTSPHYAIIEHTAGGYTVRAWAVMVPATGVDYRFALVCSGNTLTGYCDGVQICQYTSATRNTATKCGLRTAVANATFDNFEVTTP